MVVGAGYYIIKQLFPQMLQPGAISVICCCIPMVGALWLGSSGDSCVSIRAVGSAPYGGCAMLTAGPGQRVVEPAPLGPEHLQKLQMGMGSPTSQSIPVAPWRKRDLEAVGRDMALLHLPGRWLGGVFSLCWACPDEVDEAGCR